MVMMIYNNAYDIEGSQMPSLLVVWLLGCVLRSERDHYMYNGNVLGNSTGAGSAAAVATGAATLPFTGGNSLLQILAWATLALGAVVLTSFVVSRVLAKRYTK